MYCSYLWSNFKDLVRQSLSEGNGYPFLSTSLNTLKESIASIRVYFKSSFVEGEKDDTFSGYFIFSTELAFQLVGREIGELIRTTDADYSSSQFPSLFRIACKLACNSLCRSVLPLMLLDDFFESSSIEQCEKMWNVLLTMQSEIQSLISLSPNSGLLLLNIVNSLLRRTSKMKDGPFRGSVMMY